MNYYLLCDIKKMIQKQLKGQIVEAGKKQAAIINMALRNIKDKLSKQLKITNVCAVGTSTATSTQVHSCQKQTNTEIQTSSRQVQMSAMSDSTSSQTQQHLMYNKIEQQLKVVYDNVNKLRAEDAILKEKIKNLKYELKTEKTEKAVLKSQLERINAEKCIKIEQNKNYQQLKQQLEKAEEALMASQFQLLKYENQPQKCEKQQQTDSEQYNQSTLLQLDRHRQLNKQVSQHIDTITKNNRDLQKRNEEYKDLVNYQQMTIKALEEQLRQADNKMQHFCNLTKRQQRQLETMRKSSQEQSRDFADFLQCFVKEKTAYLEQKSTKLQQKTHMIENNKKQIECRFIEMEVSYRVLFEQNMKYKQQLSNNREVIDRLQKALKDKQIKSKLEICEYQKKIHEMMVMPCRCLMSNKIEYEAVIQKLKEQTVTKERHILQVNTLYLKCKEQLHQQKKLCQEIGREAQQKLMVLGRKVQQLMQHNEMLMGSKTKRQKSGGHADQQRMKKLYVSIWKDRFSA